MLKSLRLEGFLGNAKGLFKNVTEGKTGLFTKKPSIQDLNYPETKIELDKFTDVVDTLENELQIQTETLQHATKEHSDHYVEFKKIEAEFKEAKQRNKDLESKKKKQEKQVREIKSVLADKTETRNELQTSYDIHHKRAEALLISAKGGGFVYDKNNIVKSLKERIHTVYDSEKSFSDRITIISEDGFLRFVHRPTEKSRLQKDVKLIIETPTDVNNNVLYITKIDSENVKEIGQGTSSIKWIEDLPAEEIAELEDVLENTILKHLEWLKQDYAEKAKKFILLA